jgi:hypothetical protein
VSASVSATVRRWQATRLVCLSAILPPFVSKGQATLQLSHLPVQLSAFPTHLSAIALLPLSGWGVAWVGLVDLVVRLSVQLSGWPGGWLLIRCRERPDRTRSDQST